MYPGDESVAILDALAAVSARYREEEESADLSTQGHKPHAVVLIANHGSQAYMILYAAAKSDFATLNTQDFQPMLNSFTFQSQPSFGRWWDVGMRPLTAVLAPSPAR